MNLSPQCLCGPGYIYDLGSVEAYYFTWLNACLTEEDVRKGMNSYHKLIRNQKLITKNSYKMTGFNSRSEFLNFEAP